MDSEILSVRERLGLPKSISYQRINEIIPQACLAVWTVDLYTDRIALRSLHTHPRSTR
jgi:hypothetical protein